MHLGTCTLTIGVLKDLGYVPGERRGPNLPASDVGNWVKLVHRAGVALAGCVRQGRPGWTWSGTSSRQRSFVPWLLSGPKRLLTGMLNGRRGTWSWCLLLDYELSEGHGSHTCSVADARRPS